MIRITFDEPTPEIETEPRMWRLRTSGDHATAHEASDHVAIRSYELALESVGASCENPFASA